VYELIRHPTARKAGGIAVNVAIVAFLRVEPRRHLAAQRPLRLRGRAERDLADRAPCPLSAM
jgi:hypothetical protein